MDYRATTHATTGMTPSQLLHGRKMHTKLHCKQTLPTVKNDLELQNSVAKKQSKIKAYTDKKRGAKDPRFKIGDLVRVRKPGLLRRKQVGRFFEPRKIVAQKGSHTFVLDDGRVWNASYLAHATSTWNSSDTGFDSISNVFTHQTTNSAEGSPTRE